MNILHTLANGLALALYLIIPCFMYGIAQYAMSEAYKWMQGHTAWSPNTKYTCSLAAGSLLLVVFGHFYVKAVFEAGLPF